MNNLKSELYCARWTLCYIGIWFAAWCGIIAAMSESVVDRFVKDADTPLLLLEGWGKQQLWLFTTMVLLIVVIIAFAVAAVIFQIREERNPKNKEIVEKWADYGFRPAILIIAFAGFVWVPAAVLKEDLLRERYTQIQEDIAAIEKNSLRSDVVFLHPDFSTVDFVPYNEGKYADTAVRYHATGVRESKEYFPGWEEIYVPCLLNFTLDTEYVYNEWKSTPWNEEHAAMYRITYTPNIHFVVSIEVESRGK